MHKRRQQGFDLIQFSMWSVLAGIAALGVMKATLAARHEAALKEGGVHMDKIVTAMSNFVAGN